MLAAKEKRKRIMGKEKTTEALFEGIFVPSVLDIAKEEIALLKKRAEAGEALAELCLILLDFSGSTMHYNSFNGDTDELDEIQKAVFEKLDALGKRLPLAYKVAGDLYLGTMGKIVWHSDLALPYYEKYAEATGDRSILDNLEEYQHQKWEEYKDIHHRQQVRQILDRSKIGITYSHDPLFYENLHD